MFTYSRISGIIKHMKSYDGEPILWPVNSINESDAEDKLTALRKISGATVMEWHVEAPDLSTGNVHLTVAPTETEVDTAA